MIVIDFNNESMPRSVKPTSLEYLGDKGERLMKGNLVNWPEANGRGSEVIMEFKEVIERWVIPEKLNNLGKVAKRRKPTK